MGLKAEALISFLLILRRIPILFYPDDFSGKFFSWLGLVYNGVTFSRPKSLSFFRSGSGDWGVEQRMPYRAVGSRERGAVHNLEVSEGLQKPGFLKKPGFYDVLYPTEKPQNRKLMFFTFLMPDTRTINLSFNLKPPSLSAEFTQFSHSGQTLTPTLT